MVIRRIGFVGIGNMGSPMAANLLRAGFEVTVFDVRPERGRELAARHQCAVAGSLTELAARASCVVTMLPDHHAVRQAVLGEGDGKGVAAALARDSVVVDMGTSDPNATRALQAELAPRAIRVIDAPVMGGVPFARDATLDIMAGGDAATLDALEPMFAALGRKVYRCGPVGSGHALKAIANYVNACSLASVVEGLTMGARFGIETGLMIEALRAMCTGRNHPIDKKIVPHVVSRAYASGMAMGFIAKDLRIAVEAARHAGAAAPLAEQLLALWQAAADELGPACDQTEIVRYWERRSGVEL